MPRKFRKRNAKKVAKSVKTYVKKKFDNLIEDKFLVVGSASATLPNSDTVSAASSVHLTGMSLGAGVGQRVGLKIRVKAISINISGNVSGTVTQPSEVRVALFRQMQANGSNPIIANNAAGFFYFNTADSVANNFVNPMATQTYKKIFDKKLTLQVHGGSTNIGQQWHLNRTIRFKKPIIVTYYNGVNTGGISDIQRNSIWLTAMAKSNGGANVGWVTANYIQYEDA